MILGQGVLYTETPMECQGVLYKEIPRESFTQKHRWSVGEFFTRNTNRVLHTEIPIVSFTDENTNRVLHTEIPMECQGVLHTETPMECQGVLYTEITRKCQGVLYIEIPRNVLGTKGVQRELVSHINNKVDESLV